MDTFGAAYNPHLLTELKNNECVRQLDSADSAVVTCALSHRLSIWLAGIGV